MLQRLLITTLLWILVFFLRFRCLILCAVPVALPGDIRAIGTEFRHHFASKTYYRNYKAGGFTCKTNARKFAKKCILLQSTPQNLVEIVSNNDSEDSEWMDPSSSEFWQNAGICIGLVSVCACACVTAAAGVGCWRVFWPDSWLDVCLHPRNRRVESEHLSGSRRTPLRRAFGAHSAT